MREILRGQIGATIAQAPDPQIQMVIASVAEGNTVARLWVGEPPDDVALLWDQGNNVFYLSGSSSGERTKADLTELIADVIRPQAIGEGARYFKIRVFSDDLLSLLPAMFPTASLHLTTYLFFAFDRSCANAVPTPHEMDLAFLPIDADLLERSGLENVATVVAEVRWMWPTLEQFYRRGYGVAARLGNQLVCWCTAEYVSRSQCGIGIETEEGYQRLGIATTTAAHFVTESLRRGIKPHWECDSKHRASIRVAEKVGFAPIQMTTVWTGTFPDVQS